ncbi:MAG: hypothetical protein RLZZ303_1580 [Candidatus Hydrogenedentota bacterium]|jgi:hypothetical protein
MQVNFSRHARRRAALYGIDTEKLSSMISGRSLDAGGSEFLLHMEGHAYPIKVVVVLEGDRAIVVTCFPQKKGRLK